MPIERWKKKVSVNLVYLQDKKSQRNLPLINLFQLELMQLLRGGQGGGCLA
jgi:hypothetical protein